MELVVEFLIRCSNLSYNVWNLKFNFFVDHLHDIPVMVINFSFDTFGTGLRQFLKTLNLCFHLAPKSQ